MMRSICGFEVGLNVGYEDGYEGEE